MNQVAVKIGNSTGVIIPQALSKGNLKPGDKVNVEKDPASDTYFITKNEKDALSSITPHFLNVVERINKQYGSAFKSLAKR